MSTMMNIDTPPTVAAFSNGRKPLAEMRDISIAFGGIRAVDHASVELYEGEVVALLGHNGAGKSTLIKILSGAYQRDQGDIYINGEKVQINNPRDAKRYGIETIYQTLALADNVDAAALQSCGLFKKFDRVKGHGIGGACCKNSHDLSLP